MTPLDRFLGALPVSAQRNGSGWHARCPAHEDSHASLSITTGDDDRVLLHCHAGCETSAIVAAVGLQIRDLFPPKESSGFGEPTAVYDYRDEHGELLYQSLRYPPKPDGKKTFLLRRPNPGGGWIWKMEGVRRVPYHLDQLAGKEALFIVEGEKDADRLWSIGLPATTNPTGAGSWRDEYAQLLKTAGAQRVAILADNDSSGDVHARQVGRSCAEAGLFAKVILLPDLPPKGDVSDWLDAGHSKPELLEIVRNAPPFNPQQPAAAPLKLQLTSLADLLAEPDAATDWLVQDRIPIGGLAVLAGPPKGGKSTFARGLSFAVATHGEFLGWRTAGGLVWHLALEEKASEVKRHFRQMGATGHEPIRLLVHEAPADALAQLHALALIERPRLIVIDTLQRILRAKDMSDYAEITARFDPLLRLARETGAALLLLHHTNKYAEGLNSILGSTALAGSVDQVFLLTRTEARRTLSSIQRIGPDLEPTVITLDSFTGHLALAGTKKEADETEAAERIVGFLTEQDALVTERQIREGVDGRSALLPSALRRLLRDGLVKRFGHGGKPDPFRWGLTDKVESGAIMFQVPDPSTSTREPTKPHHVRKNTTTPEVPSVLDVLSVPEVPEDGGVLCFDGQETRQ